MTSQPHLIYLLLAVCIGCTDEILCASQSDCPPSQTCNLNGLCEALTSQAESPSDLDGGHLSVTAGESNSSSDLGILEEDMAPSPEPDMVDLSDLDSGSGELELDMTTPTDEAVPPEELCETTLCLVNVAITGDRNQDGALSPGESATLSYFSMYNTSVHDIEGLTGVISSASPYLTFRTERLIFTPGSSHYYINADDNDDNSDGECPARETCGQATSIQFEISPSAPIGEELLLRFDLTDEEGATYRLEYTLNVVDDDVRLELADVMITGDTNRDDILSPGESATLSYFSMYNSGMSNIIGLSGEVSSASPYLTFRTERLTFTPGSSHSYTDADDNDDNSDGECPSLGDCGQATGIRFEISEDAPVGELIILEFDLVDRLNNRYHLEYMLPIIDADVNLELGDVIFTEDSNNDGVMSPGESATLSYIVMRNAGGSGVVGLRGAISSDSPYIHFRTERLTFTPGSSHYFNSADDNDDNSDGECPPLGDCGQATAIRFEVSLDAPIGEPIIFHFDLTDRLNNAYHFEYMIPLVNADVHLELSEVMISGATYNDGALSPGDEVILDYFSILNSGTADAMNLTGVISSDSVYLEFETDRLSFTPGSSHYFFNDSDNDDNSDGLCPSTDDCGQATDIHIRVAEDAPLGEEVNLIFNLSDALENRYLLEYPIVIR